MKLMVQSGVPTATPTFSVCHGYVNFSSMLTGLVDDLHEQSKHIVIFDTLIQQSKPEEVEAVLGKWNLLTSHICSLTS
jgi:hypothetical protein